MPRKRLTRCSKNVQKLAEERNAEFILLEVPPPGNAALDAGPNVACSDNQNIPDPNMPEAQSSDPFENPTPGCSGVLQFRRMEVRTYDKKSYSNVTTGSGDDMKKSMVVQTDEIESVLPACDCEQKAEEIAKIRQKMDGLKQKLLKSNDSITGMQMALTSSLLPAPNKPFTEIDGFPNNEALLAWSVEARDSDYLFVKFLMTNLWPEGFAGRSLTGRASNNPSGRPRRSETANPAAELNEAPEPVPGSALAGDPVGENIAPQRVPVARTALEPEKVAYIKERLLERRILLRDEYAVAIRVASSFKRVMHSVVKNNSR